jgi:hypothetical protein
VYEKFCILLTLGVAYHVTLSCSTKETGKHTQLWCMDTKGKAFLPVFTY